MKGRVIVLDESNMNAYFNICTQFFFDLMDQRLLWRFTSFDFFTWKLLLTFIVTIATSCGKYLISIADDRSDNFNDLYIVTYLK